MPTDRAEVEVTQRGVQAALGPAAEEAAITGAALPLTAVIAEALAIGKPASPRG